MAVLMLLMPLMMLLMLLQAFDVSPQFLMSLQQAFDAAADVAAVQTFDAPPNVLLGLSRPCHIPRRALLGSFYANVGF